MMDSLDLTDPGFRRHAAFEALDGDRREIDASIAEEMFHPRGDDHRLAAIDDLEEGHGRNH